MTVQEAIDILVGVIATNSEEENEALDMAIEALEGKDIDVPSRKGVFIPDITVEMFRNASLEGVEELMASGVMEDVSLPSAQPESRCNTCRYTNLEWYEEPCDSCTMGGESNHYKPSAQRTGEWIQIESKGHKTNIKYLYKCSVCGMVDWFDSNYCPECGAKMKNNGDD